MMLITNPSRWFPKRLCCDVWSIRNMHSWKDLYTYYTLKQKRLFIRYYNNTQVDERCAPHLASLHPYNTPFVFIPGFLQRTQSASAYFGSAVQVQRKSILSAALLMCPPPTWVCIDFSSSLWADISKVMVSLPDWIGLMTRWTGIQTKYKRPWERLPS